MNNELLYWSAGVPFRTDNDKVIAGALKFSYGAEFFPELYYLTVNGISKKDLMEHFEGNKKAAALIRELISARVLIKGVPRLNEMFYGLSPYTAGICDEELYLDPDKLEKAKKKIVNRNICGDLQTVPVQLEDTQLPEHLRLHRSTRSFDVDKKISFDELSAFLAVFRDNKLRKNARSYPSAGGLYPIDIYLCIKDKRVDKLEKGMYYYCPVNNSLYKICDKIIEEAFHYPTNREIYLSSAVSVLMVYNSGCNMPKYGYKGYAYALLDCGIMTELLYAEVNRLGAGCCSIGDMDFGKVEKMLGLPPESVMLHTIEIGYK